MHLTERDCASAGEEAAKEAAKATRLTAKSPVTVAMILVTDFDMPSILLFDVRRYGAGRILPQAAG